MKNRCGCDVRCCGVVGARAPVTDSSSTITWKSAEKRKQKKKHTSRARTSTPVLLNIAAVKNCKNSHHNFIYYFQCSVPVAATSCGRHKHCRHKIYIQPWSPRSAGGPPPNPHPTTNSQAGRAARVTLAVETSERPQLFFAHWNIHWCSCDTRNAFAGQSDSPCGFPHAKESEVTVTTICPSCFHNWIYFLSSSSGCVFFRPG